MSVTLESLATCFQGILPSQLFTCSRDGVPNAAYLSHVDYVDASHVALSFQFFNKSRRNIAENPQALIRVIDPDTQQGWSMRLKFERSAPVRIGHISQVDVFVTDHLSSAPVAELCRAQGVRVIEAHPREGGLA